MNHGALLSKGLCLQRVATVQEAVSGSLPLSETSSERAFLTDFINCAPQTSAARLAQSVTSLIVQPPLEGGTVQLRLHNLFMLFLDILTLLIKISKGVALTCLGNFHKINFYAN